MDKAASEVKQEEKQEVKQEEKQEVKTEMYHSKETKEMINEKRKLLLKFEHGSSFSNAFKYYLKGYVRDFVLIGPRGSGKSSFLSTLHTVWRDPKEYPFYEARARICPNTRDSCQPDPFPHCFPALGNILVTDTAGTDGSMKRIGPEAVDTMDFLSGKSGVLAERDHFANYRLKKPEFAVYQRELKVEPLLKTDCVIICISARESDDGCFAQIREICRCLDYSQIQYIIALTKIDSIKGRDHDGKTFVAPALSTEVIERTIDSIATLTGKDRDFIVPIYNYTVDLCERIDAVESSILSFMLKALRMADKSIPYLCETINSRESKELEMQKQDAKIRSLLEKEEEKKLQKVEEPKKSGYGWWWLPFN